MADDDLAVDLADEHHAGDVDGLGVGDPQAVEELGLLAEALHQVADLRTAAVHDDRAHADRAHQHDVLGEQRERVVVDAPAMALPPYLTTTVWPAEAADVRQRLDEDVGRLVGGARRLGGRVTGTARPSAGRSVSARPSATLAHCTAPPDAPLARLSMAAMADDRSRCARRSGR